MEIVDQNIKIGIVGLGYVGLPLAFEFSKHFKVVGYDLNATRVRELKCGRDRTGEITGQALHELRRIKFTTQLETLRSCNVYIVTVPTPVDYNDLPDLRPLEAASSQIAEVLAAGDTVIYESTVYPGVTEDVCVPILEDNSGLKLNQDFCVGYSPERINPADTKRGIRDIVKVTSGSSRRSALFIDELYKKIIDAGTYLAHSIKVAEAAKVIENTQRDINIAIMNEFSLIFDAAGIDTTHVLEAASTKWNFLNFRPGLVGGHCISVDPHYLRHLANNKNVIAELLTTARKVNESMPAFIVDKLSRMLIGRGVNFDCARVLVLGYSFKANCPDTRNTKVEGIISGLESLGLEVDCFDPIVGSGDKLPRVLLAAPTNGSYDAIILAVDHDVFKSMGPQKIKEFGEKNSVFFDLKSVFDLKDSDYRI